jgi:transposase
MGLRAPIKTGVVWQTRRMAKPLVSDELWALVALLLPAEPPKPKGGRPRIPDRACLTGIIFVLKTGIQWELLPQELGCGSGMTCWQRLRDWQQAGVWDHLHRDLLDRLGEADRIDWSRASLDSASISPKGGRESRGQPNGSRKTGHEAPWCGRADRTPPRRATERGAPSRLDDLRRAA